MFGFTIQYLINGPVHRMGSQRAYRSVGTNSWVSIPEIMILWCLEGGPCRMYINIFPALSFCRPWWMRCGEEEGRDVDVLLHTCFLHAGPENECNFDAHFYDSERLWTREWHGLTSFSFPTHDRLCVSTHARKLTPKGEKTLPFHRSIRWRKTSL